MSCTVLSLRHDTTHTVVVGRVFQSGNIGEHRGYITTHEGARGRGATLTLGIMPGQKGVRDRVVLSNVAA